MDYIFHADCHGLQSLVDLDTKMFGPITMACHANPQRFCIWGTITLEKEIFDSMQLMLRTDEGKKEALNLIKKTTYNFPRSMARQYARNMSKIPNDELDPFW